MSEKTMESQFIITESESKLDIYIKSPFFLKNIAEFKRMGGRFSRMDRVWRFPSTPCVRRSLDFLFGYPSRLCIAVVPESDVEKNGCEWSWRGYKLAWRRYKTTPVDMPQGVRLHTGVFNPRDENGDVSGKGLSFAVVMRRSAADAGGFTILEDAVPEEPYGRLAGVSDKELLEEALRRGILAEGEGFKNQKEGDNE